MSEGGKRKFPYWSETNSFELASRDLPSVHPGQAPSSKRVFEQPAYQSGSRTRGGTDFSTWTQSEIIAFLDQRGGDYDDCKTFEQLVDCARELEVNTGPAVPPVPTTQMKAGGAEQDDDYDPLDAFMAEINDEVKEDKPVAWRSKPNTELACDEEQDYAAEYMALRQGMAAAGGAAPGAVVGGGAGGEYDSDEEVYATAQALDAAAGGAGGDDDEPAAAARGEIGPLAPLDHASMEYDEFGRNFYSEPAAITAMSEGEVQTLRRQLEIRVSGFDVPRPVKTFAHCSFDAALLALIKKAGYEQPTAIQAQALPAVLSGRDVLGLAKTGSGKTAAFVLPMLVHIMDQPELAQGAGPIGLILAPTRELAEQIHKEARRFAKAYSLRVTAAFGGLSKFELFKDLKAGSEVAVATPGRLIDLIKMKACTLTRCTYLVLDEADRMLDMGFEPQVRSVLGQVRPDRQTLLFSATLPRRIESLASDALNQAVRITVGQTGAANLDVRQEFEVIPGGEAAKTAWLMDHVQRYIDEGDVVIFAGQKARVDSLVAALLAARIKAVAIHGDMDQHTRMGALNAFRSGAQHVLVATDVAARGLDIKTIKTVINFDSAKDLDTHIHRVGRTGRAGDKEGVAVTLLMPNEARFAGQLANSLALGGQPVPPALQELADKDPHFRGGGRTRGGMGGRRGRGGRGRGAPGGSGLGYGGGGGGGRSGGGSSMATTGLGSVSSHAGGGFVQLPGFAAATSSEPSAAASVSGRTAEEEAAAGGTAAGRGGRGGGEGAGGRGLGGRGSGGVIGATESRGDVVRSFHAGRFKSSFVSSGTTGGDIGASATIVAPKVQSSTAALPPPPVPITARPMIFAPAQYAVSSSSALSGPRPDLAAAGAAAAAIAARIMAQSPGGATGVSTSMPATSESQDHRGGGGRGTGGRSSTPSGGYGAYNNAPPPASLNFVPAAPARMSFAPPASLNFAPPAQQQQQQLPGPPPMPGSAAAIAIAAAQAIAARLTQQEPRQG